MTSNILTLQSNDRGQVSIARESDCYSVVCVGYLAGPKNADVVVRKEYALTDRAKAIAQARHWAHALDRVCPQPVGHTGVCTL